MAESIRGLNNNNIINCFCVRDEETYEESWAIVSQKVAHIFNKEAKIKLSFESIQSRIYKNVTAGHSERMYDDLMSLCARHVNEIYNSLCPPDELSTEHFIKICNLTSEYLTSIKNISSMFSILNKYYVATELNSSLFTELGSLYNRKILSQRMPALMYVAEETFKVPCSFSPAILYRFFNDVNETTQGRYAMKYPKLFSRYCLHVLPPMKESDLENHIAEVKECQSRLRIFQRPQGYQGIKRSAEDDDNI